MCEVIWSIGYVLSMNSQCLLCSTVLQCRFSFISYRTSYGQRILYIFESTWCILYIISIRTQCLWLAFILPTVYLIQDGAVPWWHTTHCSVPFLQFFFVFSYMDMLNIRNSVPENFGFSGLLVDIVHKPPKSPPVEKGPTKRHPDQMVTVSNPASHSVFTSGQLSVHGKQNGRTPLPHRLPQGLEGVQCFLLYWDLAEL